MAQSKLYLFGDNRTVRPAISSRLIDACSVVIRNHPYLTITVIACGLAGTIIFVALLIALWPEIRALFR